MSSAPKACRRPSSFPRCLGGGASLHNRVSDVALCTTKRSRTLVTLLMPTGTLGSRSTVTITSTISPWPTGTERGVDEPVTLIGKAPDCEPSTPDLAYARRALSVAPSKASVK